MIFHVYLYKITFMSDKTSMENNKSMSQKIKELFNLNTDKASNQEIIDDIKKDAVFKGTNLWILIFAIIICSVGLDINSTAVIIGGMLISPLMGPLMGIGMGLSRNDLDLLKTSGYNIGIAIVLSIITSALYFYISPLDKVQSELLSRTSPAIWDVIIAISGGFAGIIAYTRKEKNNVIPGVAIATALMPPLSTAGFGIATGNMHFFWGALYLFLINSIFISAGTYIIIRILKIRRKQFVDPEKQKRVKRIVIFLILLFIAPSVYTGYLMVKESEFEKNATNFISDEFDFDKTFIISKKIQYDSKNPKIEITLYGNPIDSLEIAKLKKNLDKYGLGNTRLVINQAEISKKEEISLDLLKENVKTDILESIFEKNNQTLRQKDSIIYILKSKLKHLQKETIPLKQIANEAKIYYPELEKISISMNPEYNLSSGRQNTLPVAIIKFSKKSKQRDTQKLKKWLMTRLNSDTMKIIIE